MQISTTSKTILTEAATDVDKRTSNLNDKSFDRVLLNNSNHRSKNVKITFDEDTANPQNVANRTMKHKPAQRVTPTLRQTDQKTKIHQDDNVKRNRFLSSVATNHVVKAVSKRIAVRIKIDENPNLNEIERSKYIRVPEDIKIESLSDITSTFSPTSDKKRIESSPIEGSRDESFELSNINVPIESVVDQPPNSVIDPNKESILSAADTKHNIENSAISVESHMHKTNAGIIGSNNSSMETDVYKDIKEVKIEMVTESIKSTTQRAKIHFKDDINSIIDTDSLEGRKRPQHANIEASATKKDGNMPAHQMVLGNIDSKNSASSTKHKPTVNRIISTTERAPFHVKKGKPKRIGIL